MKTAFTLWKTKAGRILITSEHRIPPAELHEITQYFDRWAKGPEGSVLLIPDCTYGGEIDDRDGHVVIAKAGYAFALEPAASVSSEKPDAADALPEDAIGFTTDALIASMGDRAVAPSEIATEHGWDIATVLKTMRTDPRFEEVGPGVGRWQLTNETFMAQTEANRSEA